MSTLPPSPFIPSSAVVESAEALPVDVSGRDHYPAGSAAPIPADEHRHPFGCPDAEWCRGNRLCYWQCNADPDDISNIGEIFIGARKLEVDNRRAEDFIDWQALWDAIEEPPLFLRRAIG